MKKITQKDFDFIKSNIQKSSIEDLTINTIDSHFWAVFKDVAYCIEFKTEDYTQIIEECRLNVLTEQRVVESNGCPVDVNEIQVEHCITEVIYEDWCIIEAILKGMKFDIDDYAHPNSKLRTLAMDLGRSAKQMLNSIQSIGKGVKNV